VQHLTRVQRCVLGASTDAHRLLDLIDDPLRQLDAPRDAFLLGHAVDRAHQAVRQMKCQPVARLFSAQWSFGRGQRCVQSFEPCGERVGEQRIVQSAMEVGHRASPCRAARLACSGRGGNRRSDFVRRRRPPPVAAARPMRLGAFDRALGLHPDEPVLSAALPDVDGIGHLRGR